jgi:hypothetical protein
MTLEWHESALDRLAEIYVAVTPALRDAIAGCVKEINSRLALDPALSSGNRAATDVACGSTARSWSFTTSSQGPFGPFGSFTSHSFELPPATIEAFGVPSKRDIITTSVFLPLTPATSPRRPW